MNLARHGLLLDSDGCITRPSEVADQDDEELEDTRNLLDLMERMAYSMGRSTEFLMTKTRHPRKRRRRKRYRQRKGETPQQYRQRVKKRLGILDLKQDILSMNLATLRKHFGYKNGRTIRRGLFVRNVIWQVYQQSQAGNPPAFVRNGGNIRSLWYHVKPLVRRHSRSFTAPLDLGDMFSSMLTVMTSAGLLAYRDLNLIDTHASGRWVAPTYGTSNVIIMAEKSAFSSKFIELGKQYGVTVQTTGGTSSRTTVDTMLTEMADAGHDLTRPFTVFSLVDLDFAGWNIAEEFIEQMKDLGLKKIRAFRPYGRKRPLQPWIDIVSTKDIDSAFKKKHRFKLKIRDSQESLADQWISATGGLYGRGGKTWGLAADELIDLVDEKLAKKLPKHLQRSPAEFRRLSAFDALAAVTRDYLTTRVLAEDA